MSPDSPIAVFDSGVGSYSVVRVIRERLPYESIIYLADRASFPYGGKSHEELKNIIDNSVSFLEEHYDPKVIIVASNTPSIQVLDEIKPQHKTFLIGVYPPIEKAVVISKSKHIAILGTKGAIESSEIDDYIKSKNLPSNIVIQKVNASGLVALVEPGTFLKDKERTETEIKKVIDPVLSADSLIDVVTLSSTHLPFLRDYLTILYRQISFLDPANDTVEILEKYLRKQKILANNQGTIKVITTVDKEAKLKPEELKNILATMGLHTEIDVVQI